MVSCVCETHQIFAARIQPFDIYLQLLQIITKNSSHTHIKIVFFMALWPTNEQLFHKLSHSYMFQYIPGQQDSSINIQNVYTATTQTYFKRIV